MAFTEKLRYLIEADVKGAVRDIEKFGSTAEREMSRAESASKKWGGRLTAAGVGAVGFAAVAGTALASFASKSEEAERQSVKLDATLAAQPQLVNANRQAFIDLASALQDKTAADDDAVIGAEALLGQFGLTEDQILRLTPLVVDLSRKMGTDLDSAAKAVGKAVNGNVGALSRMGVVVDEDAAKTDAFGASMDALRTAVGGFAEKEGQTFSGRLTILRNKLEDVQEGIGSGVVDAVSSALGPLTALSDRFESLDKNTQKTIGQVGAMGVAAVGTAGLLSLAAGQVLKFRQSLGAAAGPTAGAIAGIAGLGAAAAIFAGIAERAEKRTHNLALAFLEGGEDAEKLIAKVDEIGREAGDEGTAAKFRQFTDELLAGKDATIELSDGFEKVHGGLQPISGESTTAALKLRSLREEIEKLVEEHGEYAVQTAAASTAQRRFADLLTSGAATEKELAAARSDVVRLSARNTAVQEELSAAVDEGRESVDRQTSALERNREEQQKRFDLILASTDADLAYENQIAQTRDRLAEYNEQVAAGDVPLEDLAQAQRDVKGELLGTGQAAIEAWEKHNGRAATAKEKVDILKLAWGQFGGEIKPGSALWGWILELTGQLDNAARPRTASFTVDVNGNFTEHGLLGRASGGPVRAGSAYVVGEEGPELFVPDQSGQIIPNGARSGTALAGGTSISIANLSLPNVTDGDSLVNELVSWSRRNGPLPVAVR